MVHVCEENPDSPECTGNETTTKTLPTKSPKSVPEGNTSCTGDNCSSTKTVPSSKTLPGEESEGNGEDSMVHVCEENPDSPECTGNETTTTTTKTLPPKNVTEGETTCTGGNCSSTKTLPGEESEGNGEDTIIHVCEENPDSPECTGNETTTNETGTKTVPTKSVPSNTKTLPTKAVPSSTTKSLPTKSVPSSTKTLPTKAVPSTNNVPSTKTIPTEEEGNGEDSMINVCDENPDSPECVGIESSDETTASPESISTTDKNEVFSQDEGDVFEGEEDIVDSLDIENENTTEAIVDDSNEQQDLIEISDNEDENMMDDSIEQENVEEAEVNITTEYVVEEETQSMDM
jgi:hypothetical protein